MGTYTERVRGNLRIVETGDSYVTEKDDIKFIRQTLEEFLGYVRTPAKALSWTFTAIVAGILGELGVKAFKWIAHWGAK